MNTSNLPTAVTPVRVKRPERFQIQWRDAALDQLIPRDHRVRAVWAYVDSLDVTPLYQKIQAVEGGPGRDPVDPKILLALWMYAIIEGISSARHLDRLCTRDLPYLWICGAVGVNYHLLSDAPTTASSWMSLLTDTIATLMHQKIVTLETVAQDGMRVRAGAGSSSLRREKSLKQCREQAAEQVRKLREESDAADSDNDVSKAEMNNASAPASTRRA